MLQYVLVMHDGAVVVLGRPPRFQEVASANLVVQVRGDAYAVVKHRHGSTDREIEPW